MWEILTDGHAQRDHCNDLERAHLHTHNNPKNELGDVAQTLSRSGSHAHTHTHARMHAHSHLLGGRDTASSTAWRTLSVVEPVPGLFIETFTGAAASPVRGVRVGRVGLGWGRRRMARAARCGCAALWCAFVCLMMVRTSDIRFIC